MSYKSILDLDDPSLAWHSHRNHEANGQANAKQEELAETSWFADDQLTARCKRSHLAALSIPSLDETLPSQPALLHDRKRRCVYPPLTAIPTTDYQNEQTSSLSRLLLQHHLQLLDKQAQTTGIRSSSVFERPPPPDSEWDAAAGLLHPELGPQSVLFHHFVAAAAPPPPEISALSLLAVAASRWACPLQTPPHDAAGPGDRAGPNSNRFRAGRYPDPSVDWFGHPLSASAIGRESVLPGMLAVLSAGLPDANTPPPSPLQPVRPAPAIASSPHPSYR
jgi:hypothetical protein